MDETTVFLRTTERRKYTSCRQAWWWSFIDGLKIIELASALRFGDLAHQSLGKGVPEKGWAPWYKPGTKRGTHPAKSFAALYDAQLEAGMDGFSVYGDEEAMDARELGISMLEQYVAEYGTDDHIRIIAPEMPAQVPMLDKFGKQMLVPGLDGKMRPLIYVLEFDAVFEDLNNGRIGLLETKTAKAISVRHLRMDEQAGSYWTFAPQFPKIKKVLEKVGKTDIDFILYNFLRKAMPDQRPISESGHRLNKPTKDRLISFLADDGQIVKASTKVDELMELVRASGTDPMTLGEVSKNQPPPSFMRHPVYRDTIDRENLMQRIRMQAWEMGQVRIGKLPVYKNPAGTWPDQHCNACEFRDMCELHEAGSNWEELRDLTMTTWDPYAAHTDEREEH